jgi:hypothetical protein
MPDAIDVLSTLSILGAVLGAGTYAYGYILKPRGDRRWHLASLLFTGLALANVPSMLRAGPGGPELLNSALLVVFLLTALACQIPVALRQRRGDRRPEDRRGVATNDRTTHA